jgi:fibro-slime domain-containing protein
MRVSPALRCFGSVCAPGLLCFLCVGAAACAHGGNGDANGSGGGGGAGDPGGANDSGPQDPLGVPSGAGESGAGGAGLTVTIRDFKFWNSSDPSTNPDFENVVAQDPGIVEVALGADQKPVYRNATGTTATTHGKMYFDQWYNDVPGTNVNRRVPLELAMGAGGTYGYDSQVSGVLLSSADPRKMWFPIDDGTPYATPFGNQRQAHNYSFTTELHTVFVYRGGESFSFSGDDDVFVFIEGKLVIDLGGVHSRATGSVQLDTLGLTKGQQYPLDLFSAERHTLESNLSFTTTLMLQPSAR